jgi:hypothetical protein
VESLCGDFKNKCAKHTKVRKHARCVFNESFNQINKRHRQNKKDSSTERDLTRHVENQKFFLQNVFLPKSVSNIFTAVAPGAVIFMLVGGSLQININDIFKQYQFHRDQYFTYNIINERESHLN